MKTLNFKSTGLIVGLILNFITAAYAVPNKINVQGRLTNNSGQPIEGTVDVKFEIYSALTGGTLLWPVLAPDGDGIETVNTNASGLFSTEIGPFQTDFFSGAAMTWRRPPLVIASLPPASRRLRRRH